MKDNNLLLICFLGWISKSLSNFKEP